MRVGHKLLHGDWRDFCNDVLPQSHAIITDPPYDIEKDELLPLVAWAVGGGNEQGKRHNLIAFCAPENQYFVPHERAYWIKTPSTKNYIKHLGRFVEMILILRGDTFNVLHWSQMTGVYDDRLVHAPVHPWEKPISLIERLVRIYTNPGDTVYDPFMGSGTTGVACKRLGRNFIGSETNEKYFKIAENRMKGGYDE